MKHNFPNCNFVLANSANLQLVNCRLPNYQFSKKTNAKHILLSNSKYISSKPSHLSKSIQTPRKPFLKQHQTNPTTRPTTASIPYTASGSPSRPDPYIILRNTTPPAAQSKFPLGTAVFSHGGGVGARRDATDARVGAGYPRRDGTAPASLSRTSEILGITSGFGDPEQQGCRAKSRVNVLFFRLIGLPRGLSWNATAPPCWMTM